MRCGNTRGFKSLSVHFLLLSRRGSYNFPSSSIHPYSFVSSMICLYFIICCKNLQYLFIIILFILMQSNKARQSRTDQDNTSLQARLKSHIEPSLKQYGSSFRKQDVSFQKQWTQKEQQILAKIDEFFSEAKTQILSQRGFDSNQNIKTDSPRKEQPQSSSNDSLETLAKDIMTTRIIIELQAKHQTALQQLNQKLTTAIKDYEKCKGNEQQLTSQLGVKSQQLQKKQKQYNQLTNQLKDLSQKYQIRESQVLDLKETLRKQYSQYHKDLKLSVQGRLKAESSSQIQRLNHRILQLQSVNSKLTTDSKEISILEQKLKQLKAQKDKILIDRDYSLKESLLAKYQQLSDKCKKQLQSECQKNKNEYLQEIKRLREDQKTKINAQMAAWFQKMNQDIQEPLRSQILRLQSSLHHSQQIQEELKKAKQQLKDYEQSSIKKNAQVKSLQQQQQQLKKQIDNKQLLIKEIAQLILGNLERVNNDTLCQKIKSKLKSELSDKQDLNKLLSKEVQKLTNISLELTNLKADIRNINTSLLQTDNFTLQKEKIKTFACKHPDHINLLSKYYERIQNIQRKNKELTQAQQENKSKIKNIQTQLTNLKDQLSKKVKELENLQVSYDSINKKFIQSERRCKLIQDEKNDVQAQKDQFATEISAKQQLLQDHNKKLGEANRNIKQKDNTIQNLQNSQKSLQQQRQRLNSLHSSSQRTISSLKEQIKQLFMKLQQLHKVQKLQLNNLQQAVISATDNSKAKQISDFSSLLTFLQNNKPVSKSGPFCFSYILQNLSKQQQKLQQHVKKFLQIPQFAISSSYRFDEFNKNFSNYLPIKSSFPFIIILRSKRGQIFGAISTGVIKSQMAIIFNLNSGKTFQSSREMNSTVFDSGYLIFGQGEMRIKNNSNLEASVNSKIFNTRCFTFKRDEVVGPNQDGDSIQLTNLQIHRIQK